MTKQEEIREGIARECLKSLKLVMGFGMYNFGHWESLTEKEKQSYFYMADQILSYLHSQGIVIKTDRELPADGRGSLEDWEYEYVAVVPLIKEK